jgi:dTDP-4-dehydrorhamnose 3,5-epimerase
MTAPPPSAPTVLTCDLPTALAAACERLEPVLVPVQVYADDRGWSMMNQMQGVMGPQGQVNYSVQYPGVVKAWHRHALQTDFWLVLMGHLKVGIYRESDQKTWSIVLGERRAGVLIIPPPLWHGATGVGPEPAGLLYYVTHAYNAKNPDEERRAFDSIPGFAWGVQHR